MPVMTGEGDQCSLERRGMWRDGMLMKLEDTTCRCSWEQPYEWGWRQIGRVAGSG